MQPLLFVQLEYSYLTKTSAISDAIFAAACAGGDHQTDNKTAGKTDANVQSDVMYMYRKQCTYMQNLCHLPVMELS